MLAVAAYVFLAPNVDFAPDLQWHDGQRIAQLVLLAVVVLVVCLTPGASRGMTAVWSDFRPGIRAALAIAFVLGLVSSVLALFPRWALLEWGLLWLLLILVLSVAAHRRSDDRLDQWLVLVFFATATAYVVSVCIIYAAMLLIGPDYGQGFDIGELYPGFSNVRFFGHLQTMLLPFLLLPALWWGTTRARRLLLWGVPAVWWMLFIVAGTRGTWVALLIGIVAVLMFAGSLGRRWAKWQIGGLLCGMLCYAIFVLGVPKLLSQPASFIYRTGDIVSLSLRDVLWTSALEFAAQHPWFGIGPMHYAHLLEVEVASHPHGAVLQWLAEWGVPAALLLTGVCAFAGLTYAAHVRRAVKVNEDDRKGLVQIALLAALAGAAAQAMVDGVLIMPVSQTLLALLCGWGVGIYLEARKSQPRQRGTLEHVFVVVLTVVAAIAVVRGVEPEIGHLAEREQAYLAQRHKTYLLIDPGAPRLLPRFWAQGWISE